MSSFNFNNITYLPNASPPGTASAIGYTGSLSGDITLPISVTNTTTSATYTVTLIQEDPAGFLDASFSSFSFESPSQVVGIGASAFRNCTNMTIFNMPPSLLSLSTGIFNGCSKLKNFSLPLNSINIPSFAYSGCGLTSITIPNSVELIDVDAFAGCTSLTSVAFDNSPTPNCKNIAGSAFAGCSFLTSFIMPNSVTSIGGDAFQYSGLTSINIPQLLSSIPAGAFKYSTSLASVTFDSPTTVTLIDTEAFKGCTSLISIEAPTTVTNIGDNAFNECSSLASINIPSVVNIGDGAFAFCQNLTEIIIPSSTTSIGVSAFYECQNLTVVYFSNPATLPEFVGECFDQGTTKNNTAYYYSNAQPSPNQTDPAPVPFTAKQALLDAGFAFAIPFDPEPVTCFKEDSKILTNKGYIPIQHLRKGDLIKTFQNGFIAIDMIGKKKIYHPALKERIKDQLYRCPQDKYEEFFEDLFLTGCHSILVDYFISEEEVEETIEVNKKIYATDDKYRLPACVDDRTVVYEHPGTHTIYHLALENDDYYMNYGIYANGLLVETCSKRYLKEVANMILID